MIRDAEPQDIRAIVTIILSAWKTAYEGIIDPSYPGSMNGDRLYDILMRNLETGLERIFVFEEDGSVDGFVSGKFPEGEDECSVIGLYVHPSRQGRGVGSVLLEGMKSHFRGIGRTRMTIRTLRGARSNSFYMKHGGEGRACDDLIIGNGSYEGIVFIFDLQA